MLRRVDRRAHLVPRFPGWGTSSGTPRRTTDVLTRGQLLGATPVAPLIGIGYMELYGESLQIALSNGTPKALLGQYLIAQAHAAVVGGIGAITAVRAADHNLSFTVSLQLVQGLGVDLGFTQMKLELDPTRQ